MANDVRELLTEAHAEIGVLGAGETMSSAQAAYGLQKINEVIDEWKTQNLTLLSITRTTFTIDSGVGEYTVGPTGSTVGTQIVRPILVPKVSFVDTSQDNNPEYPLDYLDDAAWQAITFKELTNTLPSAYYWQNTYPDATLNFWMVPTSSDLLGVIYHKAALGEYASINTTLSLAPGYRKALVMATALAMCSGYGAKLTPLLLQEAGRSLGNIKRTNFRISQLSLDPAVTRSNDRGRYDIFTDTFR